MNETEQEFYNKVDRKKFKILRTGYPDFALVSRKTGKIFFVEVKSRYQIDNDPTYGLSKEQGQMHYYLSKNGIKTYVWGPGRKIIDPTENDIINKEITEKLASTNQILNQEKIRTALLLLDIFVSDYCVEFEQLYQQLHETKRLVTAYKTQTALPYVMSITDFINEVLTLLRWDKEFKNPRNSIDNAKKLLQESILSQDTTWEELQKETRKIKSDRQKIPPIQNTIPNRIKQKTKKLEQKIKEQEEYLTNVKKEYKDHRIQVFNLARKITHQREEYKELKKKSGVIQDITYHKEQQKSIIKNISEILDKRKEHNMELYQLEPPKPQNTQIYEKKFVGKDWYKTTPTEQLTTKLPIPIRKK